jgi:Arc/MetJ family transcription regulator
MYAASTSCVCYRYHVTATQIDLDDEALAAAMRELGTATKKDTVNAALREIANRNRRLAAFRHLAERPTNEQDAADYFTRRAAAKSSR